MGNRSKDTTATSAKRRLGRLPRGQAAAIADVREVWIEAGLSSAPADRASAEEGVRLAYQAAGLEPPRQCYWMRSPAEGALTAIGLAGAHNDMIEPIDEVRREVKLAIDAQVGPALQARIDEALRARIGYRVWAKTGSPIERMLFEKINGGLVEGAPQALGAALRGQFDATWLARYELFGRLGLKGPEKLEGQMLVARSAGWWWPFEDLAILTERPELLSFDRQGRLHADEGPAVRYRDGWEIRAWHGVLDEDYVETCEEERLYLEALADPDSMLEE